MKNAPKYGMSTAHHINECFYFAKYASFKAFKARLRYALYDLGLD